MAGFPVDEGNSNKDRNWIFDNESVMLNTGNYYAGATGSISVNTVFSSTRVTVPVGMYAKAKSVIIQSAGPCYGTVTVRKSDLFDSSQPYRSSIGTFVFGTNGGSTQVMLRDVYITEFGYINALANVSVLDTRPAVSMTILTDAVAVYGRYNAKYLYCAIGDSRIGSNVGNVGVSTIPNYGSTFYESRLIDKLNSVGKDWRLSQTCQPGIRLSSMLEIIEKGDIDSQIQNANVIEIAAGTNDATDGDATATNYSANLQRALDYCIKRNANPKTNYIVTNLYGADANPRMANIASYNTVASAVVALPKYSGKNVYLLDLYSKISNAQSPAANGLTVDGLHAKGDTGMVVLYDALWALFQTMPAYQLK